MAKTESYISRISGYKVVVEPTRRDVNGRIIPGRVIQFDHGRYETSDPKEQEAIERSKDFGRLIWKEGQAPRPREEQRDAELKALRAQNAQLSRQLEEMDRQLRELTRRVPMGPTTQPASNSVDTGQQADDNGAKPPEGTKCEALTKAGDPCKNEAVTEKDGMWVCPVHARD